MRWAEIGGPKYLGPAAPPFDPRTLKWIQFHVVSTTNASVPVRLLRQQRDAADATEAFIAATVRA